MFEPGSSVVQKLYDDPKSRYDIYGVVLSNNGEKIVVALHADVIRKATFDRNGVRNDEEAYIEPYIPSLDI